MRKFVCLVLSFLMILSVSTCVMAYDNIPVPTDSIQVVNKSTDWTAAFTVTPGATVAQYIRYDGIIKGVEVVTASFNDSLGNMTITIVPWKGSYSASLYGKPIGKASFTDFADGATLTVMIENSKNYDNEIMVLISDTSENKVGLWYGAETGKAAQTTFIGGMESSMPIATNIVVDSAPSTVENIHTEPRSAYEPIPMAEYDYYFGMKTVENTDLGYDGELMLSTNGQGGDVNIRGYRGNYAGYSKIDFGETSPKSLTFRYKVQYETNRTEIQVYADKLGGTKIAETMFQYDPENRDKFLEIDLQVTEEIVGVHDIYVVFGYVPVFFSTMQFSTEKKPLNKYDKEYAEFHPVHDEDLKYTYSDTWSATDMLGRRLPGYETVGERDEERQVLMFYWANKGISDTKALNINERSRLFPEEVHDYNASVWEYGTNYYNESIYGYASNYDKWMLRKQFELFAAAGVDALVMDVSNNASWNAAQTMEMRALLHEMKQDGYDVPDLTYIMPFFYPHWTANAVENIYQTLYKIGLYSDTWYYWDGKPLLMAHPEQIITKEQGAEMLEYFNFRPGQPEYRGGAQKKNNWPWLEVYPQNGYVELTNSKYKYECVAVGIAQNTTDRGLTSMNNGPEVYGRSYTYKDRYANLSQEYSEVYGYNFQEQWDRAFELNPKAVFVTGWNEYTMGRYESWGGTPNGFPDLFNDEYSRDIEPQAGVLQDVYYYQLVANIRKFKGVSPTPIASAEKTISINGDFAQWEDVGPEFIGYKGGVEPRNTYNHRITYVNNTGRNDIVLSKVARDGENLYFYVETVDDITPYTDPAWMRLFINTDRQTTGWEGYDYVINRVSPTKDKAVLEKNTGEWSWETVGEVDYKVSGNKMMIAVPKDLIAETGSVDIEFKWNDNMQTDGNIMDFYTNGDTAPIGRFSYRYTESTAGDTVIDYTKTEGVYKPSPYAALVYNTVMALDSNIAIDRGVKVQIDPDNPDVAPKIINNKTMVPLRFLCESMEATVEWNDDTQSATITYMGKRIKVTPGSDVIRIEKENRKVQTPPQEIDGRIYIPLRDIVEAVGVECFWIDPGIIIVGTDSEKIYFKNESVRNMIKYWYNV